MVRKAETKTFLIPVLGCGTTGHVCVGGGSLLLPLGVICSGTDAFLLEARRGEGHTEWEQEREINGAEATEVLPLFLSPPSPKH